MRIKIYNCIDLNNPLRDFEVEQTNLTVLELLEHSLQRLNFQNLKDNVTVYSDGQEVPCDIWSVFKLNKTKCLKFVIKPQDFFSTGNPGFPRLVQVTSGGFSWWL